MEITVSTLSVSGSNPVKSAWYLTLSKGTGVVDCKNKVHFPGTNTPKSSNMRNALLHPGKAIASDCHRQGTVGLSIQSVLRTSHVGQSPGSIPFISTAYLLATGPIVPQSQRYSVGMAPLTQYLCIPLTSPFCGASILVPDVQLAETQ